MNEIWKPIPGFEGEYEISSYGNTRSLNRINKRGTAILGKNLSPGITKKGYLIVSLNGKSYYIHRLVMLTFKGKCPKDLTVDHIDFNKTNNRLENLEYVSAYENHHRAVLAGRVHWPHVPGELNGSSKLTEDSVKEIKNMLKQGIKQSIIAAQFNVGSTTIKSIKAKKRWWWV